MARAQAGELFAWILFQGDKSVPAFVGGDAAKRQPATQICALPGEARQWIVQEAAKLDLPIEWVTTAPGQ